MDRCMKKRKDLRRRHQRVRNKVFGCAERPRLCVFRSLRNMYVQIIDDNEKKTLLSLSTQSEDFKGGYGGNVDAAKKLGLAVAEKAKEKQISRVVFDRGGRKYHGRVQALAEGAREGGLEF